MSKPLYRRSGIAGLRTIFACACVLLCGSIAAAQYRIDRWSTDAGLPYKTVRSVLQTRDGYIWAATSDGLARFDGVRFTVFNTANSANLTTNRMESLAETTDGSLWITGEEEGLFRYRDGRFSTFTTEGGLPHNKILSLYADPAANRLQILTQKGTAVWQDGQLLSNVPSALLEEYTSLFDNTGALCTIENGVVKRSTPAGIVEYKLDSATPATILSQVYEAKNGIVWIGSLYRTEPARVKLYAFDGANVTTYDERDGLPNAFIEQIVEGQNGEIWFAAGKFGEGGLLRLEAGKFRLFSKADGLGVGVLGITLDREGGIWAATSDNGLARITRQFITSLTHENAGLTTNNIYPIYEDPDGSIFAGAWRYGSEATGGVDLFGNGRFTNFATKPQMTSLVPTSLFTDSENYLWIGAFDGVTRYRDGVFTKFTKDNGFPHSEVSAITQTRDGDRWFGTAHGLTRLRDGAFVDFSTDDGLPHNDVRCLFQSRDGTLWVGTRVGLGSYAEGKFTVQSEFPLVQVRTIYEDADGILWFGTYDAGVFRFEDGVFKPITVRDGLFDQGSFQILEDDFGRFWISCNRGIYRVSREQLNDFADGKIQNVTSTAYGVKDGMADAETNGGRSPAGFRSRKDGTLWFPTQKGIAVINPNSVPVNTLPPNVAIETCLLDHLPVGCREIEIQPGNDSLEIQYTGLTFNKPEQIKFRYMLEGLDTTWNDAGLQRTAYFTHLPPGSYSFKVSAANSDGVWNETGASLNVRVRPPVYRTWWFSSLVVLVFAGLLFGVYRRRTLYLTKRADEQQAFSRQLLESQEHERQRIAVELHDSLGQDLLIIKNWAMIGLNQKEGSRGAKQQLTEISQTASEAIDEVREIAYNLRPYQIDELGLSKAIESMCARVARASQILFDCTIDDLDGCFPKVEEINFYRIVQECVNNVVKHSGATKASVRIAAAGDILRLVIEDNGKGFDFLKTKARMQSGEHRSLGLVSLVERSRILGGTPIFESDPKKGTKITIELQRDRAAASD